MRGRKQGVLCKIIKDIFPKYEVEINYTKFDWLKTDKGGTMELDIWVPELRLVIEYDGEQHFRPVRFGGISYEDAQKKFIMCQENDSIKDNKIAEHQDDVKYFIRFKYSEPLKINYVRSILAKRGIRC